MMVYVFLADGFEEVEALTPIDFFVRAGISVQRVGVPGQEIISNSGTKIVADCSVDKLIASDSFQSKTEVAESEILKSNESELKLPDPDSLFFLPGGTEGANNLSSHKPLIVLLKKHLQLGGRIAAICIAPVRILGEHGMLANRRYTCYPGGEKELSDTTAIWSDNSIVRDENIITSRGIGTAAQFAIYLIRMLVGEENAQMVWKQTLQDLSSPRFPKND